MGHREVVRRREVERNIFYGDYSLWFLIKNIFMVAFFIYLFFVKAEATVKNREF